MVFSACATFVTALVKGLESDFHCVFNLSSICDRPGGQLGVRFPWCFHGSGICCLVHQVDRFESEFQWFSALV